MDYFQVVQPSQLLFSGIVHKCSLHALNLKQIYIKEHKKKQVVVKQCPYFYKHGQGFELKKTKSLLEVKMTQTKDIQIARLSC